MGGHRHGEVAAQLAVKSLTDAFQEMATPVLENPAKFLSTQIQQIHEAIESLTLADDLLESPRTTIVVAVLQCGELHLAHVGDSRLYHFRDGRLLYRTEDHSVVQLLHRKGISSNKPYLVIQTATNFTTAWAEKNCRKLIWQKRKICAMAIRFCCAPTVSGPT